MSNDSKKMSNDSKSTQEHFANEWHELRVVLLHSENWLSGQIKDFLLPFGITQKQFNILRILRGHQGEKPLAILDIRVKMIDKMSDASRIIDRLDRKGLIEKFPCTEDKRATRVKIKEKGRKLLREIDKSLSKLDKIMNNLTGTEAKQLIELLRKMTQ